MRLGALLLAALLAAAPALADDMDMDHGAHMHAAVGDIVIQSPRIPAPPGPVRTAAAYMAFANGGDGPDRLVAVSTPAAGHASIHRTVIENDIARMRPVDGGLDIPAGGRAALEPGGYHIMLMRLVEPLEAGDTVEITLTFEKAGDITFEIPVVAPGDGMHHDHGDGMEMDHDHDGDQMHDEESGGG